MWDPAIYDPEIGMDLIEVEKVIVEEVTDPGSQVSLLVAKLQNPFAEVGETVLELTPPGFGWTHPLSTDVRGRDVLAMVLAGAAPALTMAVTAALTTALVALVIAALAAYEADVAVLVTAARDAFGPIQFGLLYGLLAGAGAAAIVVRSQAMTTMRQPFIDSARTSGAGSIRIMVRHLTPHLIPLAAIAMLVGVTGAIVADAFVAFSGFGPNRFSWGTMMAWAIAFPSPRGLVDTPWNVLIAGGLCISLLAAAFYLLAIGVQAATDIPDPRKTTSSRRRSRGGSSSLQR